MKALLFFAGTIVLLCACQRSEDAIANGFTDSPPQESSPKNSTQARADREGAVVASTFKVEMRPALAQRDAQVCRGWSYEEKNLQQDLDSMRETDVTEWGRACYQFACSSIGVHEFEKDRYRVEVNAGGWIVLKDEALTRIRYFISDQRRPGFIATCNCCE